MYIASRNIVSTSLKPHSASIAKVHQFRLYREQIAVVRIVQNQAECTSL
jgi:hypothetical protein